MGDILKVLVGVLVGLVAWLIVGFVPLAFVLGFGVSAYLLSKGV